MLRIFWQHTLFWTRFHSYNYKYAVNICLDFICFLNRRSTWIVSFFFAEKMVSEFLCWEKLIENVRKMIEYNKVWLMWFNGQHNCIYYNRNIQWLLYWCLSNSTSYWNYIHSMKCFIAFYEVNVFDSDPFHCDCLVAWCTNRPRETEDELEIMLTSFLHNMDLFFACFKDWARQKLMHRDLRDQYCVFLQTEMWRDGDQIAGRSSQIHNINGAFPWVGNNKHLQRPRICGMQKSVPVMHLESHINKF